MIRNYMFNPKTFIEEANNKYARRDYLIHCGVINAESDFIAVLQKATRTQEIHELILLFESNTIDTDLCVQSWRKTRSIYIELLFQIHHFLCFKLDGSQITALFKVITILFETNRNCIEIFSDIIISSSQEFKENCICLEFMNIFLKHHLCSNNVILEIIDRIIQIFPTNELIFEAMIRTNNSFNLKYEDEINVVLSSILADPCNYKSYWMIIIEYFPYAAHDIMPYVFESAINIPKYLMKNVFEILKELTLGELENVFAIYSQNREEFGFEIRKFFDEHFIPLVVDNSGSLAIYDDLIKIFEK